MHCRMKENDIFIRAYDKCPKFSGNLEKLYRSSFKGIGSANAEAALIAKLSEMYPEYADKDGKIGLESLWNVFDEESVLRASGSTESKLSSAEWSLWKRTSAEIEHRKYGRETAGSLVGGRLLHDILVRMDGHVNRQRMSVMIVDETWKRSNSTHL